MRPRLYKFEKEYWANCFLFPSIGVPVKLLHQTLKSMNNLHILCFLEFWLGVRNKIAHILRYFEDLVVKKLNFLIKVIHLNKAFLCFYQMFNVLSLIWTFIIQTN